VAQTPAPVAPVKPPPPPPPAAIPDKAADIALEQAKKAQQQRLLAEQEAKLKTQKEKERKDKEHKELEDKKAKELKLRKEKEAQEREAAEKLEKEKRTKAERERAEKDKAAKDQARLAQEKKEQAQKEQARQAQLAQDKALKEEREKTIRQMMSQAAGSATFGNDAAARLSGRGGGPMGPSAGYGGKIQSAIRPNIVFTGQAAGNPTAVIEVRLLPDGAIASRKIDKSSGVPAWDKAVLEALDRTQRLPKDDDGRVPPVMLIEFKPNP
jgi:colicin import membrane protein